jgi:AbrB family looped-hinge helix DNA binding protein
LVMNLAVPFFVKVVKIGDSKRMTIPKEIADYLKINEGDTLEITASDTHFLVKKKVMAP